MRSQARPQVRQSVRSLCVLRFFTGVTAAPNNRYTLSQATKQLHPQTHNDSQAKQGSVQLVDVICSTLFVLKTKGGSLFSLLLPNP